MQTFRNWRWSVLAVAFGFAAAETRASMITITPGSIPNPPSAVSSANGTQIYTNNLVGHQYAGLGLNFPGGWAITHLNGVSVWVPADPIANPGGGAVGGPPTNPLVGILGYYGSTAQNGSTAQGRFVMLGSLNPTTVSSLSLETIGQPALSVYGLNDQRLNISPVLQNSPGPHGGEVWSFTGSGIASFSGAVSQFGSMVNGSPEPSPWGIAEASFPSVVSTPEPSSVLLAGLGALGLAARLGWRRVRRVA